MKVQKKRHNSQETNPDNSFNCYHIAFEDGFRKIDLNYSKTSSGKLHRKLTEYSSTRIFHTPDEHDISDWLTHSLEVEIDLGAIIGHHDEDHFTNIHAPASYQKLLSDFQDALSEYLKFQKSTEGAAAPSEPSVRSFLFLVPSLALYDPDISIDSTNGCVSLSIHGGRFGVLTSLIAPDGKVYYSFAGRGDRIFKITGTAKFKTARDYMQFSRVLNLL